MKACFSFVFFLFCDPRLNTTNKCMYFNGKERLVVAMLNARDSQPSESTVFYKLGVKSELNRNTHKCSEQILIVRSGSIICIAGITRYYESLMKREIIKSRM